MAWLTGTFATTDADARNYWRALREHSPQRSPFSSLPYAVAAADAWDINAEIHLVFDGQDAVAGQIAFWRQRGPYRVMVIPPFTQYTPLILRDAITEADIHARTSPLEPLLASLEARFHVARSFSMLADVRPARWRGWQATPLYTYSLPLDDKDPLLSRWSSSTRRTYRRQRNAYHVKETDTAASSIQLCVESYAQHGRPFPASGEVLQELIAKLRLQGMIRIFTATPVDSTEPEAGLIILHDRRTAHYWIAGSMPGAAMTVLLGESLPCLYADGLHTFDFVGANTPSIAEFKRRFGPTLTSYYHLEKTSRPELRLLFALRTLST